MRSPVPDQSDDDRIPWQYFPACSILCGRREGGEAGAFVIHSFHKSWTFYSNRGIIHLELKTGELAASRLRVDCIVLTHEPDMDNASVGKIFKRIADVFHFGTSVFLNDPFFLE